VAPPASGLDGPTVALLVLANRRRVAVLLARRRRRLEEYFGMTVGQTLASWSVMETVISVVGLVGVLLLSLVI
jgi:GntP family gluconate:H+ symporter